jgi:hypothetical protein
MLAGEFLDAGGQRATCRSQTDQLTLQLFAASVKRLADLINTGHHVPLMLCARGRDDRFRFVTAKRRTTALATCDPMSHTTSGLPDWRSTDVS